MKAILQSQAAECGLACLAMVAGHHGHRAGLVDLRRRFGLSLHGADLARLMAIGQALGLTPRALRFELDELGQLQLPCILHWDLNHFVVLVRVGRRGIVVLDPAHGERRLALADASRHVTGIGLELSPGAGFKTAPAPASVKLGQLAGSIVGLRRSVTVVLLLSLALQLFVLLAPFHVQWVVDQALASADRDLLLVLALGFAALLFLQLATQALRGLVLLSWSGRIGLQWNGNVFAHLMRLPLEFFERRQLADVVSRLGSVQAIQQALTTGFVEAVVDGLLALATLGLMLAYSVPLALASVAALAACLAVRALSLAPFRQRTEALLMAGARQQGHLLESLRAVQALRLAGQTGQRESGFQNLLADTTGRDMSVARLRLGLSLVQQGLFGLERILVVWLGARLVLEGAFTVGMLIAYLAYKDQFATRVIALVERWIEFRLLRVHRERLADIVLSDPEPEPASEAAMPACFELQAHGLAYRYAAGEPWILRDCSFTVAPGETVAIVGASGCGKTTLAKLLLGLLVPTEGEVRVGGVAIGTLGLDHYRRHVGAVMQDDSLLRGSLADNIALGDTEPCMPRVEAAARLAAVHEDIVALPMGYQSLVGDMGTTLSGGQKQRVLLARALYRRPRLLVLDEATSHLDLERERRVSAAVRRLRAAKLVIAHRPETIASADRVLVLKAGRIVADYRQPRSPSGVQLKESARCATDGADLAH